MLARLAAGIMLALQLGAPGLTDEPVGPLLGLASEPVVPVPVVETGAVFDDWRLICPAEAEPAASTCRLEQQVQEPGRGIVVMSAQVLRIAGRGQSARPLLLLRLPLGILVAPGVEFRIDRRRRERLAVRSCHASGCIVPVELSAAIDRALRRGLEATVTYANGDGSRQNLTLSLIGYTAARAAFDALP